MSFEKLSLIEPILRALNTEGYTKPTPIQEQSIPVLLERKDLLGCAQTGTGKTAAFAIPILQLLHTDELFKKGPMGIKCLVLTPTRELAIQIGESFAAYGRHLRLKHTVIFGGVSQHSQTQALRQGVDILIATPGRLLDLMDQRYVKLDQLKMFVLDEADRMLDMGFIHDVKKIIGRIPAKRQTIFFSATMPEEISSLAHSILTNPIRVEVTPVSSTANTIQQTLYYVDKNNKKNLLLDLLKGNQINTALVFTRTKHGADKVVKDLVRAGVSAEAIHGNKSQNARQRALSNFKSQETRVLVATDIAARGIDIDSLSHVINYELPNVPETYVHRIGRTGRAGASGISISFCDGEERAFLKDIHKLIGKTIPVVEDHSYPMSNSQAASHPPENQRPGGFGRSGSQRRSGGQQRAGGQHRSGGQSRSGNRPRTNDQSKSTSQPRSNGRSSFSSRTSGGRASSSERNWNSLGADSNSGDRFKNY
jgi:ATP-dependent RNA helicase RhlE